MSSRIASAAAILLSLAAAAPVAARPACQTEPELAAMQFRQLQIEFMVAALKCDGTGYDYRGQYAAYLHKAGPALADNARVLRAMFVRQGKGAGYIDRYLTGMSNDAQIRSQSTENYCQVAAESLEQAAAMNAHELPGYAARTIGTPYSAAPCAMHHRPAKHAAHKQAGNRT